MYGDCQVISSMGGGESSLFSSQIQNPNFNFIPNNMSSYNPFYTMNIKEEINGGNNGMLMMRGSRDEMDSVGSGSEQVEDKSGNEEQDNISDHEIQLVNKKKRYHRHTARQIQEMESLFKECPHPDDKQRMKLSLDLGLKPRQVKFWFQNRRTQMKAQHDRSENVILRAENDSLKSDNCRLQAELRCLTCPNCGIQAMPGAVPFDELRIENTRLRDELERVYCVASRYTNRPMQMAAPPLPFMSPSLDLDMNIYTRHFTDPITTNCNNMMNMSSTMMAGENENSSSFPEEGFVLMDEEKGLAIELAISSMNEMIKMCHASEPLWIRNEENGKEVVDIDEYCRLFPWPLKNLSSSELRVETSRDSAMVIMNSINLVDAFLDANKWMDLFPSIVAKAKTVQIVSSGVNNGASGSLHLMFAELQVLSPLVPTRESYFLRCCQQNVEEGTWTIVDFPVDNIHGNVQAPFSLYRRKPSGCIIQDMPNGYSRVTWVEHGEIAEEKPVHQIFSQLVHSGTAFGAHRWLAVLQRQCERVASLMARNISDLGVIPSPEARKNLMRLAQRMIKTFCINISTSSGQSWTTLSDSLDDTVRVTTRKITEPGQPNGLILCAVSTTWIPYHHYQVFNLLRDERRRSQLDLHSNGTTLHEVAHIANGSHPGNCISLLRLNVSSNSSQHVELMLQETCTDQSGSTVVYTTVDVDSIQLAMSGEDPSCIPLLPLGFSVVPAESTVNDPGKSGCLLTVGIQVLASAIPTAKLNLSSITAINNHLCNIVHQINVSLGGDATATLTTGREGGSPLSTSVDYVEGR